MKDDDDSSDEEVDGPPVDITKLPTIAKDDATLTKRLEKAKKQSVCSACTFQAMELITG